MCVTDELKLASSVFVNPNFRHYHSLLDPKLQPLLKAIHLLRKLSVPPLHTPHHVPASQPNKDPSDLRLTASWGLKSAMVQCVQVKNSL